MIPFLQVLYYFSKVIEKKNIRDTIWECNVQILYNTALVPWSPPSQQVGSVSNQRASFDFALTVYQISSLWTVGKIGQILGWLPIGKLNFIRKLALKVPETERNNLI